MCFWFFGWPSLSTDIRRIHTVIVDKPIPSPDYSFFLDFLKYFCVFWPNKQEHTIFPSTLTTLKLGALKACGLCENGRIVNVTIKGQTGLGHLHRLRAGLLLSSISWRTPADALAPQPIISGYLDDPWLLCHFHNTGLIAPNGRW